MRIQVRSEDAGYQVCTVSGELDAYTAPDLRDTLEQQLEQGNTTIVMDLRDLRYLDSTGLGILVGTAKRCREAGGDLAVVCTRDNLLKIFNISGTREILNVVPSLQDALERLAQLRETRGCCDGQEKGS